MNEIKIFIYINKLAALSDEIWDARVRVFEKITSIYENEINELGGIYNKKVRIIAKSFSEIGDQFYKKLIEHLNQNNDYHIIVSASPARRLNEILKEIKYENFLFFCNDRYFLPDNNKKDNFFMVSETSDISRFETVKDYIKNNLKNKKITFLHEGIRYSEDIGKFLKTVKKPHVNKNISKINIDDNNKLDSLIDKLNSKDILILDVSPLKLLHIVNFFNGKENNPTVLKLYGLIDGRVNKYNFQIIDMGIERFLNSLSLQKLCENIDKSLSDDQKSFLSNGIFRFEVPSLLSYASKKRDTKVSNKEELFSAIREDINAIDGINDIFIGKAKTYSFENNTNTSRTSFNYLIPRSLQEDGHISRIYYPTQFFPQKNKIVKVNVNYAYIDIIRITQIDIGESIWSCEFFVDINSIHDDPLNVIKFNNLSLINSKFETKLVKKTKDEQFGGTNYRYYIVANFDFFAIADNYPFDWQHIYISMSISDRERYGILQPVPEALLDKEFQLDGWRLMDAKTGILRKKETHHQNANLMKAIEIREEIRVGWTIARTNVVTTMKVAIPIIFLFFLNYYTVFLPFENATTAIGVLTTTFLSGIALYFSTEKPQPLRITTIDLIFIYYYLQVGLTVIITGVTSFINEEIYINSMMAMRFILPISIIVALTFLYMRIKSVRLMPRID